MVTQLQIQNAIEIAVIAAIRAMGVNEFKKTSFFASSAKSAKKSIRFNMAA